MRSMTGYGTAAVDTEALRASVTARSLNHRYLDLTVHAPRRLQALEPEVKRLVQARVQRGRVEVSIQASLRAGEAAVVLAPPGVIAALVDALRRIQQDHGLEGELRAADVARFPGIVELAELATDVDEPRRHEVLRAVDDALAQLEQMRRAEGEGLQRVLLQSLDAVEAAAGRIEELSLSERAARRDSLLEKARGLRAELGLEEGRLYQEVLRLVDRQDVAEEVQRLRSHVAQARAAVRAEGPAGKRLDFLAQELGREANTIGSKVASAPLVQEVVALKSELERLREQVQNVE
ncbi:MAG TPA: YicC/YloC family endoribonuclease [Vicinamibacteria bacterium]